MTSVYDTLRIASQPSPRRPNANPIRVNLLQLDDQWRTVPADGRGRGRKSSVPAARGTPCKAGFPGLRLRAEIGKRPDQRSKETPRKQARTGQGNEPRQSPRGDRGAAEA